jgi:hypothetical protein
VVSGYELERCEKIPISSCVVLLKMEVAGGIWEKGDCGLDDQAMMVEQNPIYKFGRQNDTRASVEAITQMPPMLRSLSRKHKVQQNSGLQ